MSECAWFKCRKPFLPPHHRSRFCTKQCQANEKNWRMMRGAPLVRELMAWRASVNVQARTHAAWEHQHGHTYLAQMVGRYIDAMTAEQRDFKA